MFIVIEIQVNQDGTVGNIVTSYADRNEAEQKFHLVAAAAAVSALPCHAVTMLTERGTMVRAEHYTHATEAETIEE